MNQWKPYLIALAVGLLVGIERENSKANQKALGVRTFITKSTWSHQWRATKSLAIRTYNRICIEFNTHFILVTKDILE